MPKGTLTTTSYAILAHLAVKPWSAFELAKQMTRGMDLIWPRAESAMYVEPKNLVAHGLATASRQPSGKRRQRTVYTVTPKGRRALARWLNESSTPSQFESEALVRVFFAEHGTKDGLIATIKAFEAYGRAIQARLLKQIEDYLRDRGPFTKRWHVIGLGARFLLDYAVMCQSWARWAEAEVSSWTSVTPKSSPRGPDLLKELLQAYRFSKAGGEGSEGLDVPGEG